MFSETLLEHFTAPRNRGPLPDADAEAEVENPVCGDVLHLWLRIRDGRIAEAAWEGRGCAPVIAAASMLTETVRGLRVDEARSFDSDALAAALGGLPPRKGHAASLGADALQAALRSIDEHPG